MRWIESVTHLLVLLVVVGLLAGLGVGAWHLWRAVEQERADVVKPLQPKLVREPLGRAESGADGRSGEDVSRQVNRGDRSEARATVVLEDTSGVVARVGVRYVPGGWFPEWNDRPRIEAVRLDTLAAVVELERERPSMLGLERRVSVGSVWSGGVGLGVGVGLLRWRGLLIGGVAGVIKPDGSASRVRLVVGPEASTSLRERVMVGVGWDVVRSGPAVRLGITW